MIQLVLAKDETTVNRPFKIGSYPLALACGLGFISVVEILLRVKCIDINEARNTEWIDDGATALFVASYQGHLDIVKLLLGAEGMNVNQANNMDVRHFTLRRRKVIRTL